VQRSTLSFVLFLVVVSGIVGLVHYYLWQRLVRAPELSPALQRTGGALLLAFALMTPLALWFARTLTRPASTIVAGVAFTWFGLAVLLLFILLASEVVRVAVQVAYAATSQPFDEGRRTFLARAIAGVAFTLALALGGFGVASALGAVDLRRVRVPLRRLPKSLSGLRIAQLTDLHIGPTLGNTWLRDVVARTNASEPDVIVITGDLVDGSVEQLRAEVAPLADLRAKHGVYFVTGNHEYYSGVDAWIAELTRLGIRVLRNERVTIGEGDESFDLAGVDDLSARRLGGGHGPNLARALEGRDPERELVLLAHQPKQVIEAARFGVGLQLSGHTHGGQIFPWNFFVRLDQPFIAGLSNHGETLIYVSRGTGFWGPPMRVGAPAEISILELVAT
jgi:uncharacterized protein